MSSKQIDNLTPLPPHHFDDLQSIASKHWWYVSRLDWARSQVNRLLRRQPEAKIFDIGAGVGSFSENLDQTLRINVTNIENDPYACALIRSKGLRLIEHDISESFDTLPDEFKRGP